MRRVQRKVIGIGAVIIGQWQRPGATLGNCYALDIKSRQCSGGEYGIVKQIAVMNFFDRRDRFCGGMRHRRQFALPADPNIAECVGHGRVNQRYVRLDGREQHDRIVDSEWAVNHFPVVAVLSAHRIR